MGVAFSQPVSAVAQIYLIGWWAPVPKFIDKFELDISRFFLSLQFVKNLRLTSLLKLYCEQMYE